MKPNAAWRWLSMLALILLTAVEAGAQGTPAAQVNETVRTAKFKKAPPYKIGASSTSSTRPRAIRRSPRCW